MKFENEKLDREIIDRLMSHSIFGRTRQGQNM